MKIEEEIESKADDELVHEIRFMYSESVRVIELCRRYVELLKNANGEEILA